MKKIVTKLGIVGLPSSLPSTKLSEERRGKREEKRVKEIKLKEVVKSKKRVESREGEPEWKIFYYF